MPRKGNVPKRDVLPDPVYGSKVVIHKSSWGKRYGRKTCERNNGCCKQYRSIS